MTLKKESESLKELIESFFELEQKKPSRKLKRDEDGVLLLDPNNSHDVNWYKEDDITER